jgi:Rrf2 family protein
MLTNKGKYGLKAMLHLAGAIGGEPMLVADIAAANQISKKFLDTILGELRKAGLVHSKKGRGGGFVLARSASEITVGHIVRALDGMLAPIACASKNYYRKCDDCRMESKCSVRLMMVDVRNAIADVLDNRSLEDMRALAGTAKTSPRIRPKPQIVANKSRISKSKLAIARNSTLRPGARTARSK